MPILIILGIIIFIFICIISLVFCIVSVRRCCGTESYDYLGMTAADLKEISKKIEEKETIEEYKKCKQIMYKAVIGEEVLRAIPLKYYENVQKLQDEGFYVEHNSFNWIVYPLYSEDYKIIASFDWSDVPHKALEEFFKKYTNLIIEKCPIEERILIKKRIYK